MAFDTQEAAELIRIARTVAKEEVLPRFRMLDAGQISTKKDAHDVVTEADTRAEAALTAAFAMSFPDALVVGEEAVSADPAVLDRLAGAGRVIVVDPIDGTWNFAAGQSNFGMILSVVEDGETVFGLHYDPVMDDWIMAHQGEGAMWGREGTSRPIQTRARLTKDQQIGLLSVALFPKDLRPQIVLKGLEFGRILSPRCAAHEYRMLTEGHVDFCIAVNLNVWDHAAGVLITQAAGGYSALLDGTAYSPRTRTGILISAANREIWNSVAEAYNFLQT